MALVALVGRVVSVFGQEEEVKITAGFEFTESLSIAASATRAIAGDPDYDTGFSIPCPQALKEGDRRPDKRGVEGRGRRCEGEGGGEPCAGG